MGLRHDHGDGNFHTHEVMEDAGHFHDRAQPLERDYAERAFTVGIGGPVGSGKTALVLALCKALRDKVSLGVVTNDIFTREDGEFLLRHQALDPERIRAVETGTCPHAAIREDISPNLAALRELMETIHPELLLVESGGDNLTAQFSRELADFTIYVIDVAGGDKVPRKGGPGITQSDLLVINKTDLAPHVGADLEVMRRDSAKMRGEGATVFAQVLHSLGVPEISDIILKSKGAAMRAALRSALFCLNLGLASALAAHPGHVDEQGGHADFTGNYHFHSLIERGLWALLALAVIAGTAFMLRKIWKERQD